MSAVAGPMVKVLFVCLGNICRSPSAEAVLRAKAKEKGIVLDVDSAGTGNWHIGHSADERAIAAAANRGIDMQDIRARQVCLADFEAFTHIFAMDRENMANLLAMMPTGGVVPQLYLDYGKGTPSEVPDPYYGGVQGFETMLDLIEDASDGFLRHLQET